MNILISGGHPSPALAVIDTLRQLYPEVQVSFVGRVVAQHTTGQLAGEATAVAERHIPFYPIQTAKWEQGWRHRSQATLSVLRATVAAYQLVRRLKPDVFLSFGSYVAVPVALACWLRGIPVVTHEQTRAAGISNRLIARWAAVVALSYEDSVPYFTGRRTVITGLPLRPQLFSDDQPVPELPLEFVRLQLPLLYITGGSTGSQAINSVVKTILPDLVKHWKIIHTCGRATNGSDWLHTLHQAQAKLAPSLRSRYLVAEQVSVTDLAWIYRQQMLLVGRSGANTVAEINAFHLPSILIPLPNSNYDEQEKNARALVERGQALLISQNELTPKTLIDAISSQLSQLGTPTERRIQADISANQALIALCMEVATAPNRQK